eukprot:139474_1
MLQLQTIIGIFLSEYLLHLVRLIGVLPNKLYTTAAALSPQLQILPLYDTQMKKGNIKKQCTKLIKLNKATKLDTKSCMNVDSVSVSPDLITATITEITKSLKSAFKLCCKQRFKSACNVTNVEKVAEILNVDTITTKVIRKVENTTRSEVMKVMALLLDDECILVIQNHVISLNLWRSKHDVVQQMVYYQRESFRLQEGGSVSYDPQTETLMIKKTEATITIPIKHATVTTIQFNNLSQLSGAFVCKYQKQDLFNQDIVFWTQSRDYEAFSIAADDLSRWEVFCKDMGLTDL